LKVAVLLFLTKKPVEADWICNPPEK